MWSLRIALASLFGLLGYSFILGGGQQHGPSLFGVVVGALFIVLAVHAVFGRRK
jgi:hypothetical protein